MRGRFGAFLLALVVLGSLSVLRIASADASPPVITDLRWTPRYPIAPSNITLYANISDSDGFSEVYATWCTLDGFCIFPTMYEETAGVFRANATTPPGTIGAAYQVYATDTFSNRANSPKIYVLFVDSITLALTPSVVPAMPGSTVSVNGTAYYGPRAQPGDGANTSEPSVGLAVDVTVEGVTTTGQADASGHFSVQVIAPTAEGTYPIEVSATDRTLTDTTEGTLAVSALPRPDLAIAGARLSPPYPVAGDTVTLEFDLRNQGTGDAVDVPVFVQVEGIADPVFQETVTVAQGETVQRSAAWKAPEGLMRVSIRIDPDDAVVELNEENNVHQLSLPVGAAPPYLWIGIGGVAVAASLGAAWALRRRKAGRTPETPPEGGKNT